MYGPIQVPLVAPWGVTLAPDSSIFVADKDSGTVHLFEVDHPNLKVGEGFYIPWNQK